MHEDGKDCLFQRRGKSGYSVDGCQRTLQPYLGYDPWKAGMYIDIADGKESRNSFV